MFDQIRTQLNDIDEAGKAMAEEQYPLYQEKQQALREKYKEILTREPIDKNQNKEEETVKSNMQQREARNKKHVQQMSKAEREQSVNRIMERLYYGLDDNMQVPSAFSHLVQTGNATLDSVNRYNILLAMQRYLPKTSVVPM